MQQIRLARKEEKFLELELVLEEISKLIVRTQKQSTSEQSVCTASKCRLALTRMSRRRWAWRSRLASTRARSMS